MNAERITVAVVDDHPLYAESAMRALSTRVNVEVIGSAEDSDSALELIRESKPEVCLLDVALPGIGGLGVLAAIEREGLPTRVLLISGQADSDTVYEAVSRGASGFLIKTATGDELYDAVVKAARGEVLFSAESQTALASHIREQGRADRPNLSEREFEVLRAIADGQSVSQIADQMNLAPGTIKMHLTRLYDKLGVSERAAAVAKAMRMGLID